MADCSHYHANLGLGFRSSEWQTLGLADVFNWASSHDSAVRMRHVHWLKFVDFVGFHEGHIQAIGSFFWWAVLLRRLRFQLDGVAMVFQFVNRIL